MPRLTRKVFIWSVGRSGMQLLGRPSHDLDFVVADNSLKTARKVADALGGAYFTLDEEFQVGRVVLTAEGQPRQELDFVKLQGENLEEDLRKRDFYRECDGGLAGGSGCPDRSPWRVGGSSPSPAETLL